MMIRTRLSSLLLLLVLSAAPAFACPLCYNPGSGNQASQAALRRAIITLLLPPVGIMAGLVGFAFRYNRQGRGEAPDGVAVDEGSEEACRE